MSERKSLEPNRQIADRIPVVSSGTAVALVPQDAGQAMEFAKLMALGGVGIPAHLRGNPGTCLRIVSDAMISGMSPFHLADDSYEISGRLAYGAKTIYAMTLRSGVLESDLPMSFKGEGEGLSCTVTGRRKGGSQQTKTVVLSQVKTRNSPLWKTDTQQQLGYYTRRAWCRLHAPDAIMGLMANTDDVIDRGEAEVIEDKPQTAVEAVTAHLTGPEPEPVDAEYVEPEKPAKEAPKAPEPPSPAEQKAIEILDNIRRHGKAQQLSQYWIACEQHILAMPPKTAESVTAAYDKRMAELMPKPDKQGELLGAGE